MSQQQTGTHGIIRQNRRGVQVIAAVQIDQGNPGSLDFCQQLPLKAPQHIGDGLQDDSRGALVPKLFQQLSFAVSAALGFQTGDGEPRLGGGLAHVPQSGGGQIFLLVRQHHGDLAAGFGLGGIGAAALAAEDQSLFLQDAQGGADGLAADPILPTQSSLRWEPLPLLQPQAKLMLQLPGDDQIFRRHALRSFLALLKYFKFRI